MCNSKDMEKRFQMNTVVNSKDMEKKCLKMNSVVNSKISNDPGHAVQTNASDLAQTTSISTLE